MLSLQLKSGEYLTIGDSIAVQVFEQSGSSFRVAVKAPRELPILRGEVLERTMDRPDGLRNKRPKSPSELARDHRRAQQLAEKRARIETERRLTADEQAAVTRELRHILDHMDRLAAGCGSAVTRERLDHLRVRLDELEAAPPQAADGGEG